MATTNQLYIDAVVVYGASKTFTVSIETLNEDMVTFSPLDLNPYSVRFTVLGSATADGEVLLQKIITQNTEESTTGIIDVPDNGQFSFTITKEETINLGLGNHPIMLELLNAESLEPEITLTEGGLQGEFNKISIVQV